jgi:hypothetical protein
MQVVWINPQHLTNLQRATAALGAGRAKEVMRLALNQAGAKIATRLKHELVIQTGLSYTDVNSAVSLKKATTELSFEIIGAGPYWSLSHFLPRPVPPLGVVARPWFRGQLFPHTFMIAALGNNVYKRVGKGRWDIEKLYGPSVAREMEREPIPQIFEEQVKTEIEPAIDRKLGQFMPY